MTTALLPSTAAIIQRGKNSWHHIKVTAAEQRQHWRNVGEALLVGRRENPSNQAFGAWCKTHGFDMHRNYRAAAMWLASNWGAVASIACNVSDPIALQSAHRESQDTTEPVVTAEPTAAATTAATTVLKHHRRLAAVDAHRKGNGPEAETAKRQFAKTAEALGVSQDELSTLIDRMDPFGKLAPELRSGLQTFMNDVRNFTRDLKALVQTSNGVVTPDYLIAFISAELKG